MFREKACHVFEHTTALHTLILDGLAWAEMKLALSKLIWAFDLELNNNNGDDWADQKVFLMPEKKALNVTLEPTNLP